MSFARSAYEALSSRQSDDHQSHLYESRASFAISRATTMLVLATVCVALRFVCRKIRTARYASDDWMLLAALVSLFFFSGGDHSTAKSCPP